jgi:hypothetical protein
MAKAFEFGACKLFVMTELQYHDVAKNSAWVGTIRGFAGGCEFSWQPE